MIVMHCVIDHIWSQKKIAHFDPRLIFFVKSGLSSQFRMQSSLSESE